VVPDTYHTEEQMIESDTWMYSTSSAVNMTAALEGIKVMIGFVVKKKRSDDTIFYLIMKW
jgi:hypothetical protein